jgi:hypothetical protein
MTSPIPQDDARPSLRPLAFEALLQAHLDGTLSPTARRVLEAELASNAQRRQEFEKHEAIAAALRAPVPIPDQTGSILADLERLGAIRSPKQRFRESLQRWSVAAGIALAFGAGLLWGRTTVVAPPASLNVPTPVSSIAQASPRPAATLARANEPAADATASMGLKLGSTAAYDRPLRWDVRVADRAGADWRDVELFPSARSGASTTLAGTLSGTWLGQWPGPKGTSLFDDRPAFRIGAPIANRPLVPPQQEAGRVPAQSPDK